MLAYIARRLVATIPVMLVVAIFVFLMLRLTPSDPAAIIAGDNANAEQVAAIRTKLGLDQPILTQFFIWMGKLFQGDFGESFFFKKTVAELIADRVEPTLSLAVITIILAVAIAVPLGVIAAYKQGTWIDRVVMGFSVLGFSVPVFVIGYLLIYIFAIQLNWLPVQGYQRIGLGVGGWFVRLILPALTLSIIYVALIARMTRTSVLEVLSEDYIRTARAKGQVEIKVLFRHALKNAAVPIVTVIGLGVALLIGGVVVTNAVYTIPGLGRLTVDAVLARDFPTIQAVILLFSLVYVLINLSVDLIYTLLDPEDPLLSVQAIPEPLLAERPAPIRCDAALRKLARNPGVVIGGAIVALMILIGLLAPLLGTMSPTEINPVIRNKLPGFERTMRNDEGKEMKAVFRLGTDSLGRDVYSRVIYGARISITIGITVAVISVVFGLLIGLVAGYFRWVDAIVMRIMDGLMAIPAILLAIALVSLFKAGLLAVIVAITFPEIPRVVRLVRSVVLSVREEPYVEAAIVAGTPTYLLLFRHVLPNTIAPLIVQGTFICASAILVEAILSFLGVGIPPETPTWGNIMAEGRQFFRIYPHNILYPGIFLAITVLAVNMLGDGLRDTLDPKMEKRGV